jgi:hypothetical protein
LVQNVRPCGCIMTLFSVHVCPDFEGQLQRMHR